MYLRHDMSSYRDRSPRTLTDVTKPAEPLPTTPLALWAARSFGEALGILQRLRRLDCSSVLQNLPICAGAHNVFGSCFIGASFA
jgi:hypothetical protein